MITIGTQYYRAPTPNEKFWEQDIKQAKEHGLDIVRFWLIWNSYSNKEGQYDFDKLQRLLDICEKNKMKVIMLVNLESVPAWTSKKYPDSIYIDSNGHKYMPESVGNTPGGGFPGLCFHNEKVVNHAKEYISKVADRFKDHPAIECWEPHNEPMFEPGRYNDNYYCYCEHSINKFREYLKEKYENLSALNNEWCRNYGEWDEIEPPRRRGIYNDWMDWRLFNLDSLIDNLDWRIGTIRDNDPNHYVMIHTRGGSGITRNLAKEGIDDYRMSNLVDKYGTAAFPQCAPEFEYFIAMTGARCAAKGKEFWMAELQSGPYGMGVHRNDAEPVCEFCGSSTMEATIDKKEGVFDPGDVTADRLNMWSWSGVAQGAKGIVYWQYRNESFGLEYGFGLVNQDGSPHERLKVVKKFHDVLSLHEDVIDNAVLPENKIALAWDPKNDIINWTALGCTDAVKNSIKGIYKSLWHCDYPIDVLRLDNDVVDEEMSSYDIIFVPFSPRISSSSAEKMKKFVHQGGTLILEGSSGQFDDAIRVTEQVPAYGLSEMFGCTRKEIRTMPVQLIPDVTINNIPIKNRMHKEVLEPMKGSEIIGTFQTGEVAAVVNQYGAGKAIYLGCNPFISYAVDSDKGLLTWIEELCKDIYRPVKSNVPDVIARILKSGEKTLLFVMNTLAEPQKAEIVLDNPTDGEVTITEISCDAEVSFKKVTNQLVFQEDLKGYGTKVYIVDVKA